MLTIRQSHLGCGDGELLSWLRDNKQVTGYGLENDPDNIAECVAKGINAKGACIGPRGARVTNIMESLGGEKIDIVDYSDDPAVYVGNSLAPSKVVRVDVVDHDAQTARVVVPDYQLSLAIGREGQNARLAARLTGWKIDIHSDADLNAGQ